MNNKVTIADIARELNLTGATVSRALNNRKGTSEETRKLVQAAAEKMNYRRDRIAWSLRSGRTNIIGVIIPSAEINFFGSVVHGIESLANQHGYNVLIYQSNEQPEYEKKAIETFLSTRVDGILASIAKETMEFSHYLEITERGVPLVFFDRANDSLNIPSVVVDDFKGAYYATEHLLKQGYTRVAHIAGQQHLKIFKDRLEGYKAALSAYKVAFDDSLVYFGDVSINAGRQAITHLLALPAPPDAVFAVEDFTALGAVKELKDRQVDIPADFGVIGFANESFDEHITPSLSSIDQQTVEMGKEAFRLLMELIEGTGSVSTQARTKIVLEPVPRFRQSSQK
ncbi:LacI family DNA-binding transcriptional regulator [Chitinophaga pinensis]|uniref:Transcriptional regulator, LacI family n=1 Tax=Chitinophaga pinensis (strain ATCC 43595 / DSM 2588 / LMG 13176 / NBRC 15968 / NCIMB 11800 / UQM 2034) TaxID=485918 RepID=A0A979G1G6_CHIPD|nr:LacI family DNA-binding transcriptional regulator [Chitinophaga pinensis]ACU58961.1 transcriptional regulator, LacI family [Chitinophaga pinensis DSM 2588]